MASTETQPTQRPLAQSCLPDLPMESPRTDTSPVSSYSKKGFHLLRSRNGQKELGRQTPMSNVKAIRQLLQAAIEARDGDAFEHAVVSAFEAGPPHELSDIFTAALPMQWHTQHEDLVSGLQTMKAPEAVDVLYETALLTYEYLDYDEFFGLARKCTWALADIGTPAARMRLKQLAGCANELIAGFAQKRLDSWQAELVRKGQ